jgi:low affinity Fe/Cu permease
MRHNGSFLRLAKRTSWIVGRPVSFGAALLVIVGWAASGPFFGFSDTWQLVINTSTTIVTFLMVFLIQNTQYRDSAAVQLKLDELLRSTKGAHNALLDLEELDQADLERIRADYEGLAELARRELRAGRRDTGVVEVRHRSPS